MNINIYDHYFYPDEEIKQDQDYNKIVFQPGERVDKFKIPN